MAATTVAALFGIVPLKAQSAVPTIRSVVNGASFRNGLPSGGALATVFIDNLTGTEGTQIFPLTSPLPLIPGAVWVNNAPAPIISFSIPAPGQPGPAQINFQVPLERNATFFYPIGSLSPADSFTLTVPGWRLTLNGPYGDIPGTVGIFSDANGYAIASRPGGSLVNAQSPAHAGETVTLYVNDLVRTWPPPPIGIPVPPQFTFQQDSTLLNVSVGLFLGSLPNPCCTGGYSYDSSDPQLTTSSPQLAPGMVGVEQINFLVPKNQAPGDYALFFYNNYCDRTVNPFGCTNSTPVNQFVKFSVR